MSSFLFFFYLKYSHLWRQKVEQWLLEDMGGYAAMVEYTWNLVGRTNCSGDGWW